MTKKNIFKYFKTSLKIIKLTLINYVLFPPSVRQGLKHLCAQPLADWRNSSIV